MMSADIETMNEFDLDVHATTIWRAVSSWRGENGDEVRGWLEKFWRSKHEKTRRQALRRADFIWTSP